MTAQTTRRILFDAPYNSARLWRDDEGAIHRNQPWCADCWEEKLQPWTVPTRMGDAWEAGNLVIGFNGGSLTPQYGHSVEHRSGCLATSPFTAFPDPMVLTPVWYGPNVAYHYHYSTIGGDPSYSYSGNALAATLMASEDGRVNPYRIAQSWSLCIWCWGWEQDPVYHTWDTWDSIIWAGIKGDCTTRLGDYRVGCSEVAMLTGTSLNPAWGIIQDRWAPRASIWPSHNSNQIYPYHQTLCDNTVLTVTRQ
jgi:hypothetical protein